MGIRAHHFEVGARERLRLVEDDRDCHDLIARVSERLGSALLAYCIMATHLHAIVAGLADDAGRALEAALGAYARAFSWRHERRRMLLRGPVRDHGAITDAFELGRAIYYVHANPVRTRVPIVERAVDYRWSSQRAFAGLSLGPYAAVPLALKMLGPKAASWVGGPRVEVADAAPAPAPTAPMEVLLAAAAEVYGVPGEDVLSRSRAPAVAGPRALFVRLGRLEGFKLRQLGGFLGRGRSTAGDLDCVDVSERAVRIARTLIRTPAFRRQLPAIALSIPPSDRPLAPV